MFYDYKLMNSRSKSRNTKYEMMFNIDDDDEN